MEEIIYTYKVNLDYETSLFANEYNEDSPANQKIIREFEYIFFLINKKKCVLKNSKNYNDSYLKRLAQLGFVIPDFNPNALNYHNWWGTNQNRELEKILNSKLTSAKTAQLNNWGFEKGKIISNLFELKLHLQKFPSIKKWIIKAPNSFSGIGHYQFNAESIDDSKFEKILKSKVLLEPVYNRLFDIGTTFEIIDGVVSRQFMVENFNSQSGSFKGGAGSSNVDKFKKYIFKKYNYSLNELEILTKEISEVYFKMGATTNIQIDSFVYLEDGELKLYALVEVNYRKTMGLVIQSLAEKHSEADWIEWKVDSVKNFKQISLNEDCIRLSPEENYFQSFLLKGYL